MNNVVNHHQNTGIAYGMIGMHRIDPDGFDFINAGESVTYKEALAEHLAVAKREHEDRVENGEASESEFDEDKLTEAFADSYQCDEEIYEGTTAGVKWRTTYIGGALHLWIFESPCVWECRECSICVPGAGNLDQAGEGNYIAYGPPLGWLTEDFKRLQFSLEGPDAHGDETEEELDKWFNSKVTFNTKEWVLNRHDVTVVKRGDKWVAWSDGSEKNCTFEIECTDRKNTVNDAFTLLTGMKDHP
jgi:hypothetical protein